MNILQLALRRIAVRSTADAITNSAKNVYSSTKKPKEYTPEIPSIKGTLKNILMLLFVVFGAMVFVGIISIFSYTLAVILASIIAFLFLLNGIIINKTNDKKTEPLFIEDKRYSDGYRQDGFIDVIDNNKFIEFTTFQRILYFIDNLLMAAGIVASVYFVHQLINLFTK